MKKVLTYAAKVVEYLASHPATDKKIFTAIVAISAAVAEVVKHVSP